LDLHGYAYNAADQRTSATNADGSYWVYQYDALGQVTNGVKKWANNNLVAGEQFGYGFDTIGNRTKTLAGGDQNGANRRQAGYTANALNQYSSRTVPGAVDVIGSVTNTGSVWVDQTVPYRTNNYFWEALPVTNGPGPVYQTVTTLAALTNGNPNNAWYGTTNIGHVFVPETPESYSYDLDGNLLADGHWNYTWDGENRLIALTNNANIALAGQYALTFAYDYQGRRIQKLVWTNSGSAYVPEYTNRFVYDGWNLSVILNPGGSIAASFMWGTDLSGSMQGAGGVGGLLAENLAGNGVQFAAYDANGNVAALVSASSGTVTANYEYGPFGEVIRATGPMAKVNPFRFSTKYQDDETGLLYYGYRFYNPSTGRWLSRDPIDELGFALLQGAGENATSDNDIPEYDVDELDGSVETVEFDGSVHEMAFVNNDPVNNWDMLGMASGGKTGSPKQSPPSTPKQPKKKKPYKVKNVKITFYCNCKICTGKSPGDPGYGETATGKKACKGTIAADWKKFPKGSTITFTMPDGTSVTGTVEDKGGGVKGLHLDIWCADHADAIANGTFTTTITVTPPAPPPPTPPKHK
jgi:RHS repeat-associated protein